MVGDVVGMGLIAVLVVLVVASLTRCRAIAGLPRVCPSPWHRGGGGCRAYGSP